MWLRTGCWKCFAVSEIRNKNFEIRIQPQHLTLEFMEDGKKKYDLEERTEKFSLNTRDFCLLLKRDIINREYIIQLIRSSGSVAANYRSK